MTTKDQHQNDGFTGFLLFDKQSLPYVLVNVAHITGKPTDFINMYLEQDDVINIQKENIEKEQITFNGTATDILLKNANERVFVKRAKALDTFKEQVEKIEAAEKQLLKSLVNA